MRYVQYFEEEADKLLPPPPAFMPSDIFDVLEVSVTYPWCQAYIPYLMDVYAYNRLCLSNTVISRSLATAYLNLPPPINLPLFSLFPPPLTPLSSNVL